MAPTRPLKRQKTNPDSEPARPQANENTTPEHPQTPVKETASERASTPSTESKRSSWYQRTWPSKATPITQTALEAATAATSVASQAVAAVKEKTFDKPRLSSSPSLAMTLGKSKSNRGLPADATITKVYATSGVTSPSRKMSGTSRHRLSDAKESIAGEKNKEKATTISAADKTDTPKEDTVIQEPGNLISIEGSQSSSGPEVENKDNGGAGWFGWWSGPDVATTQVQSRSAEAMAPLPPSETDKALEDKLKKVEISQKKESTDTSNTITNANKRTWFQMLSSEPVAQPKPQADSFIGEPPNQVDETKTEDVIKNIPTTTQPNRVKESSASTSPPPTLPSDGNTSSGWAFWSRAPRNAKTDSSKEETHVGELAISHTASQDHPKRASLSVPNEKKKDETKFDQILNKGKDKAVEKIDGTQRPSSTTGIRDSKPVAVKQDAITTKAESSKAKAIATKVPQDIESPRPASPAPSTGPAANLLLPAFADTLKPADSPSMLQQLTRLLYYTKQPGLKRLSVLKDPPRIKNALAIGVHGYFPAPLIRSVLGQPTGTSIKFADMAAKAVKRYVDRHGYDCQVKSAALEGEGKIADRVDLLWKLLLNWIDEIRKSDFVLVACHSQGVPVAIMLVAKLIQFGCINSARVAICAMAGVNMGPFPEFKSRWIGGSAGELFEFSDPNSKVSTDYLAALDEVLKFGVRLSFVGSIDDQLVSLESAIFTPITHPHIYRAVQIDSRIHAPSFLSHLVGFALKLRNLGVQDHGLIRELSSPLAGSLYTSEGHSRIYEDDAVYDLAVSFGIETNSLINEPMLVKLSPATVSNPYILPFAMRGVLEEEYVKNELQSEASELLKEFDDWKPTTKVLKDVKFRLEGIRSRI